jgi:uncharacterized protein (DUF1800 family)
LRREAGLNENLAREILELHIVGADAGYTQADVTEFARALTGWSIRQPNLPGRLYAGAIDDPSTPLKTPNEKLKPLN